jgi:molecular chaperone Hsp33
MTAGAIQDDGAADVCLPFILSGGRFRGRLVRLTSATTAILAAHDDPEAVSQLLAEAMVAAVALASGLKYSGIFTLQIQGGRGPVYTLVTDITSEGHLRGCAKFDPDRLSVELSRPRAEGSLPQLLGPGARLSFTVDQGPDTERYQGIVELAGESLAEGIHHYFRQSEQLESAIKIAVAPSHADPKQWTAAALLIQRMPEEGAAGHFNREEAEDLWRTAVIFLSSLKDPELLDLSLTPERVLNRLYATMGIRFAPRRPIAARCRCSRERSERILASFPMEEIRSFADNGEIHMTCEFCRADYVFREDELQELAAKFQPHKRSDS